ncbi:MAG: alpha/beta hydrolase, partial [Deltaproteobacteria bacterium]|nr:alpha/beta hydrolase [Deltaproteobacteria bacterium]
QVTLEDLAGWKKVLGRRRNVVFKTYKKANHLLIDGKGLPRPQEYKHAGHVTRKAVEDIAAFVLGRRP